MNQENAIKPDAPTPLRPDQLPPHLKERDPTEGDENGPFLVINKSGDVLDRRHYCQWRAPEYGDGYSDFRSDYDFSPEYLAEKAANQKQFFDGLPKHIKEALAEAEAKKLATKPD